jgi:predicted metallopeptidase
MPGPAPASHFDFTSAMSAVCRDVCQRVPEFQHINMDRVAVCYAQARSRTRHGIQARLTPMRFENGALFKLDDGETWTLQRVFIEQQEMLYLLTFFLPRFLDQTYEEKLITIFHELYHISPRFNGDIRRFPGRCHAHSNSQRSYDQQMADLARSYLSKRPPAQLLTFLKQDFRQIKQYRGDVIGQIVPVPRLIRVSARAA